MRLPASRRIGERRYLGRRLPGSREVSLLLFAPHLVLALSLGTRAGSLDGDPGPPSPSPEATDPAALERRFAAALQAWREGRAAEARAGFAAVTAARPDLAGAWFWLARAARATGDLDAARRAVLRSLELEPDSPDARYLAGLIAEESGLPDEALAHFEATARAAPDGPLAAPAREHAEALRWRADRERALDLLGQHRLDEARALLEELDARRPGDAVVGTALGTVALSTGRPEAALARLDAVIAAHPDHEEARYWRALALDATGRREEAREILARLVQSPDATVASAARRALDALPAADPSPAAPRSAPRRLWSWWSVAAAWDDNPVNVSDAARDSTSPAATGPALAGTVRWRPRTASRTRWYLASSGELRAYLDDGRTGEDVDYARLGAGTWAERAAGRWMGWVGARADASWLGWAPLLDREAAWVGGRYALRDRLHLRLQAEGFRRAAHQDAYANLTGGGFSVLPTVRVGPAPTWHLDVGLTLAAEDASPYEVGWTATTGELITVDAEADWRGLGPRLAAAGDVLPDRLEFDLRALLLFRDYTAVEQAASSTGDTAEGDRADRYLSATAALGLRVAPATWLFARATRIANDSSLDADTWLIDREFRRTLVLVGVEARP